MSSIVDAGLTARERQVLGHIAAGWTYQQTAHRLKLSPHTVNAHLRTIRAKYGLASKAELIVLALRLGLISLDPVCGDGGIA